MTKSYLFLWQGQLVSMVGDVVYEIALGFWILAATGSTALMGGLMAASIIPRVLLGPFAGVWVDRLDRKWLLVLMDVVRGAFVVLVGVAALLGFLKVWMVFAAGMIIGIGGAFFNPAVMSVLPDLVEREHLVKANSGFSMIRAGSGIIGNSAGGFLFALLGAPIMFLANGISYLVSAVMALFVRVPKIQHPANRPEFWADLKSGLRFAWGYRGLRFLFICAAVINFFATIGFVLILPLFQRSPMLGPSRYGLTMAILTLGMLAGMVAVASVKVSPRQRLVIFCGAAMLMTAAWALFPLASSFLAVLALMFIGGFLNAIVNVYIDTITQLTVPQEMRGKIYGLLGTLAQGLTPIAMAVGGLLAEFIPIPALITGSFAVILVIMIPMIFARDFRSFLQFDPEAAEPLDRGAVHASEPAAAAPVR